MDGNRVDRVLASRIPSVSMRPETGDHRGDE
jgi:hypothetical protein